MFFKNKITEKNETSKQENQTEQNQYKAEKAAASEQNSTDNSNTNKSNEQNNSVANNQIDESTSNSSGSSNSSSDDLGKQYVETQIATFTTKIYTKDEARQNSIIKSTTNLAITTTKAFLFITIIVKNISFSVAIFSRRRP